MNEVRFNRREYSVPVSISFSSDEERHRFEVLCRYHRAKRSKILRRISLVLDRGFYNEE